VRHHGIVLRLHQLYFDYAVCRHDIVFQLHWLYFNYVMRRDYSSSGRTGSTLHMSCVRSLCFTNRLVIRLHCLYLAYAVRPVALSHCSTRCRVALALLRLCRMPWLRYRLTAMTLLHCLHLSWFRLQN
jgi:hypothetical protein